MVVLQKEKTFEVQQNNLKKFTINFDSAVKSLGSVSVSKLLPVAGTDYELPQTVMTSKLTEDGKSATIELFDAVENNVNYKFTVEGYEPVVVTASAGAPKSIKVTADPAKGDSWPFVTANTVAELTYYLYDVNGVDVTEKYKDFYVEFAEKTYSENYSVGDKSIWFAKDGDSATVVVTFHTQEYDDNGNEKGNVSAEFTFVSQPAATVAVKPGVTGKIKVDNTELSKVPLDETNAVLNVTIKFTTKDDAGKDEVTVSSEGALLRDLGTVSFEETSAEYFAISKSGDAVIYPFKEGSAQVVVYLIDANGKKTAIGVVPVTISAGKSLNTVTLNSSNVTVGTQAGLDVGAFHLTLKDNYNGDYTGGFTATVEAVNKLAKDSGINLEVVNKTITVCGSDYADAFDNLDALKKATSATFSYKVKVSSNGKNFEVPFTVTVKKPIENAQLSYSIETVGGWGEIARTNATGDTKKAKTVSFKVYSLNNGAKYEELGFEQYKDKNALTAADEGKYFVRITKDGKDITKDNNVTYAGGAVSGSAVSGSAVAGEVGEATINFSKVDNGVVKYDLGAGNYVVTLYQAVKQGTSINYRTLRSISGQTVCNPGSYTLVSLKSASAASTSQDDLRACFNINNTANKDAKDNADFKVDVNIATASSGFVFVKSITFYDDVAVDGDGAKAEYTVNINRTISVPRQ